MPSKKVPRAHTRKRLAAKPAAGSRLRPKALSKAPKPRRKPAAKRLPPRAAAGPVPAVPATPAAPRFVAVMPSLAVHDVARSQAFYRRLGFRVTAQLPPVGPPEWLRLERDGVGLLVWNEVVAAPEVLAALRQARGAGNTVRIVVSDIDGLLREFGAEGVHLHRRIEVMPDGSREFSVVDPDGFHLEFATPPRAERPAEAAATPA